jgi:hypothetical protein
MARDCKASPDNEFGFVRFFGHEASVNLKTLRNAVHAKTVEMRIASMFAFDRSALALLLVVVMSSHEESTAPQQADATAPGQAQTVAANLPSK